MVEDADGLKTIRIVIADDEQLLVRAEGPATSGVVNDNDSY